MNRRDFIKSSGVVAGALSLGMGLTMKAQTDAAKKMNTAVVKLPRYRGFNLTEKTGGWGPRRKFNEEDFEMMAEWGFDFARIPMSYMNWTKPDNWMKIDEEIIKDIDEVVELGKQYGIHINLNYHRIPGYCINGREMEPYDLFDDTPENMQKALDAAVFHWAFFAERYKGIPSERLSFDLINEPPKMTDETRYVEIVKALFNGIKEKDPGRIIIADGKDIGRNPVIGLIELGIPQSTRGYDPMALSHYTATWVPEDQFETHNKPTWPLTGDDGKVWDKEALRVKLIESWKPLTEKGISVHVGEWGCFNKTPHDVMLAWMEDILSLWKDADWGFAMWNLRGDFGILNSNREDVAYEDYKGHKLDRKMLELMRQY